MDDIKIINTLLIEQKMKESRLSQTDWADLLGVNRGTFKKYRENWLLMRMSDFVMMCRYLGVGIKDVLWYEETRVRLDYIDVRAWDSLTGREMEMIARDNVSSELDLREYFHVSLEYLRKLRANTVNKGEKFCCIPPIQ